MLALVNEEDVKIKMVVAFLQSLGFDISELYYEKSFHLHVGRFTYRIDTGEQIRTAQPRLDILVTRNGQNLFIVEVKGPDIDISSNDIDQAVSYARLVHPIVPLCLITNGQVWKLVDTITKEELSPDKVDSHHHLTVSLPDEAYYQAIKYFLSYSRENILAFCQWQVTTFMRELRGTADDRDKKYIPELYEERRHLAETTQQFMQAEARCFSAVGDSGSGKTCWACHSALHSLEQGVVTFFYRGSDIVGGILEAISRDLNWVLSQHYDDIQAVKRLLELFEHEQILVWIDDIDGLSLASVPPGKRTHTTRNSQHSSHRTSGGRGLSCVECLEKQCYDSSVTTVTQSLIIQPGRVVGFGDAIMRVEPAGREVIHLCSLLFTHFRRYSYSPLVQGQGPPSFHA